MLATMAHYYAWKFTEDRDKLMAAGENGNKTKKKSCLGHLSLLIVMPFPSDEWQRILAFPIKLPSPLTRI
jgi:hypothetical protein